MHFLLKFKLQQINSFSQTQTLRRVDLISCPVPVVICNSLESFRRIFLSGFDHFHVQAGHPLSLSLYIIPPTSVRNASTF